MAKLHLKQSQDSLISRFWSWLKSLLSIFTINKKDDVTPIKDDVTLTPAKIVINPIAEVVTTIPQVELTDDDLQSECSEESEIYNLDDDDLRDVDLNSIDSDFVADNIEFNFSDDEFSDIEDDDLLDDDVVLTPAVLLSWVERMREKQGVNSHQAG